MAALSHTSPDLLIEQMTPWSAIGLWKASLLYWLPRSEWCSSASGLPRRQMAVTSALATSRASVVARIDQPTARREKRSMAAAA